MILLEDTDTLELETSSTSALAITLTYVDIATSTWEPGTASSTIEVADTTTILDSPSSSPSEQRKVCFISIKNTDASVANTIKLIKKVDVTTYEISPTYVLAAGEVLLYIDGEGYKYYAAGGVPH